MMESLSGFFSLGNAGLVIRTAGIAEILFCVLCYANCFHRRSRFALRCVLCTIGTLALIYVEAVTFSFESSGISKTLSTAGIYMWCFTLLMVLFQERLSEILLCLATGLATQMLSGRIFEYMYKMLGYDPYMSMSIFPWRNLPMIVDWAIYYAVHVIIILPIALIFRSKSVSSHSKHFTTIIMFFSVAIMVVAIPLYNIGRGLEKQSTDFANLIRVYSVVFSLLVLFMRKGILDKSNAEEEKRIMSELLYTEKKQFETVKNEIDVINMKCHDIRHQLSQYEGQLTDSELAKLKETVSMYDFTLKTGSDILDIIIYKKQNICQQNGIQLSCIADGGCLAFITPSHLYSLLNNALDNAINAVMQIDDSEKRIISLSVSCTNGIVAIHVTNYCAAPCSIKDGMPQTTSQDKSHHGFGIKSMQYIAQMYGGQVSFENEDSLFYLHIYIPHP